VESRLERVRRTFGTFGTTLERPRRKRKPIGTCLENFWNFWNHVGTSPEKKKAPFGTKGLKKIEKKLKTLWMNPKTAEETTPIYIKPL
jgi:hypothetical protein